MKQQLIRIEKLNELTQEEYSKIIIRKDLDVYSIIEKTIAPIHKEIIKDVEKTVSKYNKKWDLFSAKPLVLSNQDLKLSYERLLNNEPEVMRSFINAYSNIHKFHKKQILKGYKLKLNKNILGVKYEAFSTVGLYVPGGKALYPSTVLMGAIPAKIAGVGRVIIATPPDSSLKEVSPIVQAMAYFAGVECIIQAGGPHAILALAQGLKNYEIPPVDFICGPGNIYVTAAKVYAFSKGFCGIDSFAGPSEVLIIADHTANPLYLAHDLLSQAEHDENASSILLCTDAKVAYQTQEKINEAIQTRQSKRQKITTESIKKNGLILIVDSLDDAIQFSNTFAPEHLEIHTKKDHKILPQIKSAGSIFLGQYSPVAMGDYYSGTNHILPTNRAARYSSGLGVQSFYKRITYQNISKQGILQASHDISVMSKQEGLFDEHGLSVLIRGEDEVNT